jgi:hypothetical protein
METLDNPRNKATSGFAYTCIRSSAGREKKGSVIMNHATKFQSGMLFPVFFWAWNIKKYEFSLEYIAIRFGLC